MQADSELTAICSWEKCPHIDQFKRKTLANIFLDEVKKLYLFLQGELPKQLHMKTYPKLSGRMVFKVIYYLQEIMHLLPDRFERCVTCGTLYDSYSEGSSYQGMHCDQCRKD